MLLSHLKFLKELKDLSIKGEERTGLQTYLYGDDWFLLLFRNWQASSNCSLGGNPGVGCFKSEFDVRFDVFANPLISVFSCSSEKAFLNYVFIMSNLLCTSSSSNFFSEEKNITQ